MIERGFTTAYEHLAANAILPNELGIEFKLRNEQSPSRQLEDTDVVKFVTAQPS